jgi:hypothetical protein
LSPCKLGGILGNELASTAASAPRLVTPPPPFALIGLKWGKITARERNAALHFRKFSKVAENA